MTSKKPTLIVFEGVDKSGKSTLIRYFHKKTNYSRIALDRFTVSCKIYCRLFGRNDEQYYDEFGKYTEDKYNLLVVVCTCNSDEIRKRLEIANEKLPDELIDIDNIQNMFIETAKKDYKNVIIVDTSRSLDVCTEEIKKAVEDIENEKNWL